MTPPCIAVLIGHNTWATNILIEDAAALSLDAFHRRFEIGPGSLHDTLRHIVGAMLRWADRIGERTVRDSIESNGRRHSAEQLGALLAQADGELRGVAAEMEASSRWHDPMEFAVAGGPKFRFQRLTAMLHVLTHGMHHRAQALNIRRRLGRPPLGYDLDVVEWECFQNGQLT